MLRLRSVEGLSLRSGSPQSQTELGGTVMMRPISSGPVKRRVVMVQDTAHLSHVWLLRLAETAKRLKQKHKHTRADFRLPGFKIRKSSARTKRSTCLTPALLSSRVTVNDILHLRLC